MVWDFAECNPFCHSSGSFDNMLNWIIKCISEFPAGKAGIVSQQDAASDNGLRNIMVSTDPPYYDNIGYADLSDYFYIWLRRSLKHTYPELFRTMLVPKAEELVATPYRFDGSKDKAKRFFEDGMLATFKQVHNYTRDDIPVTVYYAFKQSESTGKGEASTGWETMLTALINAGFAITGTWPIRTEREGRSVSIGTNALASSIVLVCRKRGNNAAVTTRRDFVTRLRRNIGEALDEMLQANISPVDLAQSAIGPGMAIYSQFSQVLESDGSPMTVRTALELINEAIDHYYSEQEGDLDKASRYCLALYTQCAFDTMPYGEAEVLASAKNIAIQNLEDDHLLDSDRGKVHLLDREALPEPKVGKRDWTAWGVTQNMVGILDRDGVEACARFLAGIASTQQGVIQNARELIYQLYSLADKKGWTQDALAYTAFIASWPEIETRMSGIGTNETQQSFI